MLEINSGYLFYISANRSTAQIICFENGVTAQNLCILELARTSLQHGARKLGITSVLPNNLDKNVKTAK